MNTCSIEGCRGIYKTNGLCRSHYYRRRVYGDPLKERVKKVCCIDGCKGIYQARGLCRTHYSRLMRLGDPLALTFKPIEKCTINDCNNDHVSRGFCHKHYKRWQSHGNPSIVLDNTIKGKNAFEILIEKYKNNPALHQECWEWDKKLNNSGYGSISYRGKTTTPHRAAYKYIHGEIPDGMCICHHCDNRKCFNFNHLFLGTHKDNMQDCIKKERRNDKKGQESHYAKLTEKDVHEIRKQIKDGFKNTEIAKKYKVSHAAISCIRLKTTWNHLGENLNDNT